jgi:hypothetical protein
MPLRFVWADLWCCNGENADRDVNFTRKSAFSHCKKFLLERSHRLFARNGVGHRTIAKWRGESFEDLHPRGSGSGYDEMTDLLITLCGPDARIIASESAKSLRGREKEFFTNMRIPKMDSKQPDILHLFSGLATAWGLHSSIVYNFTR